MFPQKLAGSDACDTLEEASEMVGEVEAEEAGGLADIMTVHQQTFGLVDDVVVNVSDGSATSCLVYEVAEIPWRICQL